MCIDEDIYLSEDEDEGEIKRKDDVPISKTCGEIGDIDEEDDDEDDDSEEDDTANTDGTPYLVPSYYGRKATAYFSYPPEMNEKREVEDLIPVSEKVAKGLRFFMHWKRQCVQRAFSRAGFTKAKGTFDWVIFFGKHFNDDDEKFEQIKAYQRVNHFPGSWCIGRKDRLSRLLHKFSRNFKEDFHIHPQTFVLPNDSGSLIGFLTRNPDSLFIRKPVASSCGRGISVLSHSQSKDQAKRPANVLMQEYIPNPLCLNGYKFDLRIYVLVTSFDPLRCYQFYDGLVRIATIKYNKKNLNNKFCHLTNSSINEKNKEYTVKEGEEEGSKWCFETLHKYFDEHGLDYNGTWERIRDLIVKTLIAANSEILNPIKRLIKKPNLCYEVFGFDILIDKSLKPWLIEVNISPALKTASTLDTRIKDGMVTDIFHLVGPEPYDFKAKKKIVLAKSWMEKYKKPERLNELKDVPPELLDMVMQTQEEYHRRGHWIRLFPTSDSRKYLQYFSPLTNNTSYIVEFLEKLEGKFNPLTSSLLIPQRPTSARRSSSSTPSRRASATAGTIPTNTTSNNNNNLPPRRSVTPRRSSGSNINKNTDNDTNNNKTTITTTTFVDNDKTDITPVNHHHIRPGNPIDGIRSKSASLSANEPLKCVTDNNTKIRTIEFNDNNDDNKNSGTSSKYVSPRILQQQQQQQQQSPTRPRSKSTSSNRNSPYVDSSRSHSIVPSHESPGLEISSTPYNFVNIQRQQQQQSQSMNRPLLTPNQQYYHQQQQQLSQSVGGGGGGRPHTPHTPHSDKNSSRFPRMQDNDNLTISRAKYPSENTAFERTVVIGNTSINPNNLLQQRQPITGSTLRYFATPAVTITPFDIDSRHNNLARALNFSRKHLSKDETDPYAKFLLHKAKYT